MVYWSQWLSPHLTLKQIKLHYDLVSNKTKLFQVCYPLFLAIVYVDDHKFLKKLKDERLKFIEKERIEEEIERKERREKGRKGEKRK